MAQSQIVVARSTLAKPDGGVIPSRCFPSVKRPGLARAASFDPLRSVLVRAARSVLGLQFIAPMPPDMSRPVLPSTLTGCSVIDLSSPPIRTLAPTPTPTVALAVAPAVVARQGSGAHVRGRRDHVPHQRSAVGVSNIDTELRDVSGIAIGTVIARMIRAVHPFRQNVASLSVLVVHGWEGGPGN